MAKSLKIQIEMAGAEEIKRQLEGVGEAGEAAFQKIIDAAQKAGGFNKLDPSVVTQSIEEFGVKGEASINKITTAVRSAGRMEVLVNALTGVENGLAKVQSAASAVDNVLGKALIRSLTMVARLLPAAFAAATVGAIATTTAEILKLDAAAIKLGVSVQDLSKMQEAFEKIGVGAEAAAKGVAGFIEKLQLEKVKEAAASMDEFGRSSKTGADWMKILRDAASGTGEAADLARKKLAEMGQSVELSAAARAIDDIKNSTKNWQDKLIDIIGVLEKMGNTAERDRLIFANFDKDFGTKLIQVLNAGIPLSKELIAQLAKVPGVSQEAAAAATRVSLEWQKLKNLLASGFEISPEGLNNIANILATITATLPQIGAAMRSAFGGDIFSNTIRELQTIGTVLSSIGQFATTAWNALVQGAQTAAQSILQFFSQLPQQIASFFAGFGTGLWDGIVSAAQTAVQMIGQSFQQVVQTITSAISSMGEGLWDSIVSSAQSAWDQIVGFIENAINKARQFAGMSAGGAAGGRMARGGVMGGRGTGTSDSNLAWLSRGEHVMPARAVAAPGVLAFLEALRRSGGNLRGVLDRMGHFAAGGMVSAPAFARGGAISGMSNVTIQFPGVQPITGLRASSAVVDELRRSAALAQVRSGGRKPSRYT